MNGLMVNLVKLVHMKTLRLGLDFYYVTYIHYIHIYAPSFRNFKMYLNITIRHVNLSALYT